MNNCIIFIIYIAIICIAKSIETSEKSFNPTTYTLYFKSYDFPLNNPKHWDWTTTTDGIATRACTKQFTNLCVYINESKPGFNIEYNDKQYIFLNDANWHSIDINYGLQSVTASTKRQLLYNYYGTMAGYGRGGRGYGAINSMMGGTMNQMGTIPGMGGVGFNGMGPQSLMGMQNQMGQMSKMYTMMGRMLAGKSMFNRHSMRGALNTMGGTSLLNPNARRRRRRRRRRRKKKRKRRKNYLQDGGQFGKMGFPSLSGNMMGLVQSSQSMPNFMKVPPTIHINAEFRRRRLINMNVDKEDKDIILNKCIIIDHHEICAQYNFGDKSIGLRYIVPDHYEVNKNENVDHDDGDIDVDVEKDDYKLLSLFMLNEGYGVWRNGAMFDDINGNVDVDDVDDVDDEYIFKTVVWSDINRKCNDLLLSFIDFTICIEEKEENKDVMIYFKNNNDDEKEEDGDIGKMIKSEYKTSILSVSNDMDWNEIYDEYENTNIRRLCKFMPIIKLCAKMDRNNMKISDISVEFVSLM